MTAAFADLTAATPEYTGLTPPKLPDPSECERLAGLRGITLGRRFEYRGTAQPGWLGGQPSGEPLAEFWMRFADGRPADTLTLPFITDAAPPAVLELGAGSITIELTVHVRARPAPGWLACRSYTRFVTGGYHEEDFEVWDSAGTLVAQSRQLALIRPFSTLFLADPSRAAAIAQLRPRSGRRLLQRPMATPMWALVPPAWPSGTRSRSVTSAGTAHDGERRPPLTLRDRVAEVAVDLVPLRLDVFRREVRMRGCTAASILLWRPTVYSWSFALMWY